MNINSLYYLCIMALIVVGASCSHGTLASNECKPLTVQPGTQSACLEHEGRQRNYIVHVPHGDSNGQPMPLILNFHGRKGNAKQQAEMSRFHELADREKFIVVEPQGVEKSWNVGICCERAHELKVDDIGFIRKLIAEMTARLSIDRRRIYATGFSNGGRMTHQLGCELAAQIAAIAPMAAPLTSVSCKPSRPVPVFTFHGTADACIPYKGGRGRARDIDNLPIEQSTVAWAMRNGCNEKPIVTSSQEGLTEWRFQGCRSGSDVMLYATKDAGHIWPGAKPYLFWRACGGKWLNNFDATEEIWKFFKSHPLPLGTVGTN